MERPSSLSELVVCYVLMLVFNQLSFLCLRAAYVFGYRTNRSSETRQSRTRATVYCSAVTVHRWSPSICENEFGCRSANVSPCTDKQRHVCFSNSAQPCRAGSRRQLSSTQKGHLCGNGSICICV